MAGYPLMGPNARHTIGVWEWFRAGADLLGSSRWRQGTAWSALLVSGLVRLAQSPGGCIADSGRRKQVFPPLENW